MLPTTPRERIVKYAIIPMLTNTIYYWEKRAVLILGVSEKANGIEIKI